MNMAFGEQRCLFSTLFLVLLFSLKASATSYCETNETPIPYLDIAAEMIEKAKENSTHTKKHESGHIWICAYDAAGCKDTLDCSDIFLAGHSKSGVYKIWPKSRVIGERPLKVYCDMDTDGGGWTVIQRRGNFSRSPHYFFKNWANYKAGFGNIQEDFWLGNDNIFGISNQRQYSIRFDLQDMEGEKRYALYESFWIDGEINKYMIHIDDYIGDAGDSMQTNNEKAFSTRDQDNDSSYGDCAQTYKGAWWYNSCSYAHLNALDHKGPNPDSDGIAWKKWKKDSLASTEMKIRPRNFEQKLLSIESNPN